MARHRICQRCGEFTVADGACSSCGGSKTAPARDRAEWRDVYGTRRWRTEVRPAILERDEYTCQLCGSAEPELDAQGEVVPMQVDHIVSLLEGGAPFDEDNLRATHRGCNLARRRKAAA